MRLLRTLFCALVMTIVFSLSADAANYDLKEITPAVQKAIGARQARYAEVQRLKSEGVIGEENQGSVKLLKDSSGVAEIIQAENQDRQVIYEVVVEQNQLGSAGMSEVRAAFAEVQRGKAKPGDFIQLRTGEWVQK